MVYSLSLIRKLKLLKWDDVESQILIFLVRVESVKWKFARD